MPGDETIRETPSARKGTRRRDTAPSGERHSEALPGRGDAIGRYLVLDLIGEGGMGAVYAAYDPTLDRRVALKVLVANTDAVASIGPASLVREAKAMARLNHPNVIQVFEVGTLEGSGDVYIAMEYVDGVSLRDWLDAKERSLSEIVDVFLQAGRALSHAHSQGVVHRDFKPENCLVDTQGRVRVIDFGIARTEPLPSGLGQTSPDNDAEARPFESVLVGTPAYMAPEQLDGRADARSDQFALAVALYEAIYGQRPFGGRTLLERIEEISRNQLQPLTDGAETKTPPHVHQALTTALRREPELRHDSMDVLLTQLSLRDSKEKKDKNAPNPNRVALGIGFAVLTFGAALVGAVVVSPPREEACEGLEQHLEGVWDEAAEERLVDGLEPNGVSESTRGRIVESLNRRAREWVEMRQDACEDTRVRGEVSAATMDLRMGCLDRRLEEMRATLTVIQDAGGGEDPAVSHRALQLVSELGPLERCGDITRLEAEATHAPPPDIADEVQRLRATAVRVQTLEHGGAFEPAQALAATLVRDARALDYEPLVAEALQRQASVIERRGEHDRARALHFEAVAHARRSHAVALEVEIWTDLTYVELQRRHPEDALRYGALARAALDQLGDEPALEGILEYTVAMVESHVGPRRQAHERLELAEQHLREAYGAGHWRVALVHEEQAILARQDGEGERSLRLHRQALDEIREAVGPEHPMASLILNNLALSLRSLGRYEQAREVALESLELKRRTLGPQHPTVLRTLRTIASHERRLARFDEAAEHLRQARTILAQLPDDHPDMTLQLFSEAMLALDQENYGGAVERFETARELAAVQGRPRRRWVAANNIGLALYRAGRLREAETTLREVVDEYRALGLEPMEVAYPQAYLGAALVASGQHVEGIELLETALRAWADRDVPRHEIGLVRYALAQALYDSGRDPTRAALLLRQATADFRAAGGTGQWALPRLAALSARVTTAG